MQASEGGSPNKETFHLCPQLWLTYKYNHLFISASMCVFVCAWACGQCVTQIASGPQQSIKHGAHI